MSLIKSLRFKLTITYSLILFIFAGFLVLSLNLFLENYLHTDPTRIQMNFSSGGIPGAIPNNQEMYFPDLPVEEKERIRDIRLKDLETFQEISLIALIPLALFSFGIGYAISGSFLEPLKELKNEIDESKSESLGKQIKVKTDDEIGELIKSYNEMSLRLQKAFECQKQFVQDASHELRTPLTIMQTNMDIALEDKNASKEELRIAIEKSLEAAKNMTKLSENLLTLTMPSNDGMENS